MAPYRGGRKGSRFSNSLSKCSKVSTLTLSAQRIWTSSFRSSSDASTWPRTTWSILMTRVRSVAVAMIAIVAISGNALAAGPCDSVAAQMLAPGGDSEWSPATDVIAYDKPDESGVDQLWTIRPDGSEDTCL